MRGGHIRHQRSPVEAAVQSVPPDVFSLSTKAYHHQAPRRRFSKATRVRLTALVIVGMWSSTSCLK